LVNLDVFFVFLFVAANVEPVIGEHVGMFKSTAREEAKASARTSSEVSQM